MAKKKKRGHYCRIYGASKPNEAFSGKGHAKHICKECSSLPQERKSELQHINQIDRIAGKYPRSRQDWEFLEKMSKNKKYPEAAGFAQMILGVSRSQPDIEPDDNYIFENPDIDYLPVFSEKKKFSELDSYEKMVLRDYIRSEITEHLEFSNKIPTENDLIEIRKRMTSFFDDEHNILLKKDVTLRKFFEDNAASIIHKLQKKAEDNQ
ncbi:hypothetical protein [Dysgonomonas sp. HGC4]|uniref:hypothetical protein n=2 Tax=Dysgonomonas sp. HGC4 TaxID=1658009 RepID=UPI000AC6F210|nr:hypothetical protein [Dysgonomonas sp. HGC4]